jgi:hypothetical protein
MFILTGLLEHQKDGVRLFIQEELEKARTGFF